MNIELTKAKVDVELLKSWIYDNISCTPKAIIDRFNGTYPRYYNTALNGHYGVNGDDELYPWEKLDLVEYLKK